MAGGGKRDFGIALISAPLTSMYWWKGKLEKEPERLIFLKTRRSLLPDLKALLGKVHPYEVPELVFIAFAEGSGPYLSWLGEVLGH
jgi:periplasmic divalent cation tolerance protein